MNIPDAAVPFLFNRNELIAEFTSLGMDRLTSLDLLADSFQTVMSHLIEHKDPLVFLQLFMTDEIKTDVDFFKAMVESGYVCNNTHTQYGFINTIYAAKEILKPSYVTGGNLVTILTGFCDIPFFSIIDNTSSFSVNFVDSEIEQQLDTLYWNGRSTYYAGVIKAVDLFLTTITSGDIPVYCRMHLSEVREHIKDKGVFLWDATDIDESDEHSKLQLMILDEICEKGPGNETIPEEYLKQELTHYIR